MCMILFDIYNIHICVLNVILNISIRSVTDCH